MKKYFATAIMLLVTFVAAAQQNSTNRWEKKQAGPIAPAKVEENESRFVLSGSDFEATINKTNGIISSYIYKGKEIISKEGIYPFFRNSTLNSENAPLEASSWKSFQKRGFMREEDSTGAPGNRNGREFQTVQSIVSCQYSQPETDGKWLIQYTIFQNGVIKINYTFEGEKRWTDIPHIGMCIQMPDNFNKLSYNNGNKDVKTKTKKINPEEKLQKNIRWCTLTNKKGNGFLVIADNSFNLNISVSEKAKNTSLAIECDDARINKNKESVSYEFTLVPLEKKINPESLIKQY